MNPEVNESKTGVVLACYDIPDCPICGGRSVFWCLWHSPKGNDYYICSRCDAKLTDEDVMEHIRKLDEQEGKK